MGSQLLRGHRRHLPGRLCSHAPSRQPPPGGVASRAPEVRLLQLKPANPHVGHQPPAHRPAPTSEKRCGSISYLKCFSCSRRTPLPSPTCSRKAFRVTTAPGLRFAHVTPTVPYAQRSKNSSAQMLKKHQRSTLLFCATGSASMLDSVS